MSRPPPERRWLPRSAAEIHKSGRSGESTARNDVRSAWAPHPSVKAGESTPRRNATPLRPRAPSVLDRQPELRAPALERGRSIKNELVLVLDMVPDMVLVPELVFVRGVDVEEVCPLAECALSAIIALPSGGSLPNPLRYIVFDIWHRHWRSSFMWWKDPDLPRKGHQLHWVEVGHRVPTCRERRRRSFAIHREHRRFDSILDCGRIGQRHLLRRR